MKIFGKLFKQRKPTTLQRDIEDALMNYRAAEAKIDVVLDADMVDAAIYEYMAAKKRLNHLIRLSRKNQELCY